MDGQWGLLAASVVFLAPFFVHEMFFTWPKLLAATQVLVAFYFVRKRRPGAAGGALGFGYLCHPMAVLAAPFLFLWILGESRTASARAAAVRAQGGGEGAGLEAPPRAGNAAIGRLSDRQWPNEVCKRCLALSFHETSELARFAGALLAFVAGWLALGRIGSGPGSGQEVFFRYFFIADGHSASAATWIASRWNNFANTFIPFRLMFTDPTQPTINSIYGLSDGWVHFGFLYWNTLPFAVGWPEFLVIGPAVLLGIWRTPRIAMTSVVAPAALLVVYWGYESTGLMLQCGQWLFLAAVLFGVWTLSRSYAAQNGKTGMAPEGKEPGKFLGEDPINLGHRAAGSQLSRARHWGRFGTSVLSHPFTLALGGLDVAWMAFGTTLHARWPDFPSPYGWNDLMALALAAAALSSAVAWLAVALAGRFQEHG
jgi:hypothetical protein